MYAHLFVIGGKLLVINRVSVKGVGKLAYFILFYGSKILNIA